MAHARALLRVCGAVVMLAGGLLAVEHPLAPAESPHAAAQDEVLRGHSLYFQGRPTDAIAAYKDALRREPGLFEAWVNGAVVWDSLGRPRLAAAWYARALKARPDDALVRAELGELQLRRGLVSEAREALDAALQDRPADPHALIARGRVELARGRPQDAVPYLERAAKSSPAMALAWYWLGVAQEQAGRLDEAVSDYDRSVSADSYFTAGRYRLARALAREGRIQEALDDLADLRSTDSGDEDYKRLAAALRPRLKDAPRLPPRRRPRSLWLPPPRATAPADAAELPPPTARVPLLRVGIGTTGLGHPVPWRGLSFASADGFEAVDTRRGRRLARGAPGERWEALALGRGGRVIELRGPSGRLAARTRGPLVIEPAGLGGTELKELPGGHGLERRLRGRIELTAYRGGLEVVDIVDLETYTDGVLSSEMPIDSPMEALKAQAVLARTDALYIKENGSPHRADGYDLCDGQHCQVYRGMAAETARSRAVIAATRGRIVTYKGRPVDVLYSADCGGHSQSASEVHGWGDPPYFVGRSDTPEEVGSPSSPWLLRQWLRTVPPAFCSTSRYVQPSHFRWERVVSSAEMERRLDRSLHIGRLLAILPLRRARSGHLNAIEVVGSLGSRRVDSELRIRSLFAPGSQRSSLFVMDTEYDAHGRPARYVFYGGGWGHGVGLCQSGAMGRAAAGQDYIKILRAYYTGVDIGSLRY